MDWVQKELKLRPRERGFHLITAEVAEQLPELKRFKVGIAHLFIKHSSASITLNENADPDVRHDMEAHFNVMVPEHAPYYRHTAEGPDDMPAHLKAALIGNAVTLPITHGGFNLGTWQGVYLCEHRDHACSRRLVVTLQGQT